MGLNNIPQLDLADTGKTVFYNNEILLLFHEILLESKSWDLGLGFFSFSGFRKLAWPLANFMLNNGNIRIYCNEKLSENDYNSLIKGDHSKIKLNFFEDLFTLYQTVQNGHSQLFADCISYLIYNDKLKIKFLVKKDDDYGISHQKNFIFRDEENNLIVLSGSANLSETALSFNNEDVSAYCSFWTDDKLSPTWKTISEKVNNFEQLFEFGDETWQILELESNELKSRIKKIGFQKIDDGQLKDSMIKNGRDFILQLPSLVRKKVESELTILDPTFLPYPSFPYDAPYPYQDEAHRKWVNSNHKGLFAMATGTGKTLTAINCLVKEYNPDNHRYIFVVPGQELVRQWEEELHSSNFGRIYKWFSGDGGAAMNDVRNGIDLLRNNPNARLNIVTTYQGFQSNTFKNLLSPYLKDFTIIFDEVHEMGAPGVMENMMDLSESRLIGLSATPERQFDEGGANDFINKVFNCNDGEYTFEFSMERAIKQKFLVPYDYYVRFIHLTNDEWELYCEKTAKLYTSDENGKQIINSMVAMARHRIISKAYHKFDETERIVGELFRENNHKFTLIYCPEGSTENFQKRNIIQPERLIDLYLEELHKRYPKIFFEKLDADTPNRNNVIKTFEEGRFLHQLISMKVLDQGVNVPNIRNAILVASATVIRQHIQRRGRILRTSHGKKKASLYDLIVLPPSEVRIEGNALNLVNNEFRRVHEFWRLCDNRQNVIEAFDEKLNALDTNLKFDILLNNLQNE
jgi:superfamily II DNA or RNA helicase